MKIKLLLLSFTLLTSFFSIESSGSFLERHTRFMGPGDIISTLVLHFPEAGKSKRHDNNCFSFSSGYALEWGAISPSLGAAAHKRPSSAFLTALSICADFISEFYLSSNAVSADTQSFLKRMWPADIINLHKLIAPADFKACLTEADTHFSATEKNQIIQHMITQLIGPESVLVDFGYQKSLSALAQKIFDASPNGTSTIGQWSFFVLTTIMTRDEFLMY